MANIKKIDKSLSEKKDVGGTNILGKELDPNNELKIVEGGDKGQTAYYKGQKMRYLDYYNELCERNDKSKRGRDISIGAFSGVSFDKNGKIQE